MKVHLLGVRPVSFPDKTTGELVEGLSLYVAYPDSDVIGLFSEKIFIKMDRLRNLKVDPKQLTDLAEISDIGGAQLDFEFNPRKQLCGITLC